MAWEVQHHASFISFSPCFCCILYRVFPVLLPGWWQTCEYWLPPTAYPLWLNAELSNYVK